MKQILVYGDSISWGMVPGTRERYAFDQRWPGVLEAALHSAGLREIRIVENAATESTPRVVAAAPSHARRARCLSHPLTWRARLQSCMD